MKWEVEQKFRVGDARQIEAKLAELKAVFKNRQQQIDRYFNHPGRDFARTDEALRLRQIGVENFITYKGPKIDQATKTRRELELPLPSGSQIPTQFTELLTALGFRAVATVQKARQPATIHWENHDVEVALDEVQGLGWFLELEIVADDAGLDAARAALQSLAQRLALEGSERRSYLELMLESSP